MNDRKMNPEVLPEPSVLAAAHSQQLQSMIMDEMSSSGGCISFQRFMNQALYAPGLGYYSAGLKKFGEGGDFITASELSPLFSRCLAEQCQQVMRQLDTADILELGAGSGVMACDVLQALEALQCLPEHYYILDLSADLRDRQRRLLEARVPHLMSRIQWLESLPSGFEGVILANEVLDAMPVHRVAIKKGHYEECYVALSDTSDQAGDVDNFVWRRGELSDERLFKQCQLIEQLAELGEGEEYITEINLAAVDWLASISESLQRGMVLMIDYGFPQHEFYHPDRSEGTLMCHYRHRAHSNPLILCGLQDVTAHVDFTALAEAALSLNLGVSGYTTQAYFLLGCGLAGFSDINGLDDQREQIGVAQQINKLTSPAEMGELFKVIALTRDIDGPFIGFMFKDMRGRL